MPRVAFLALLVEDGSHPGFSLVWIFVDGVALATVFASLVSGCPEVFLLARMRRRKLVIDCISWSA
jgi:hypothetical protein